MPKLTAINFQEFSNKAWRMNEGKGFGFAAHRHLLPVAANEISKLIPVMPMGFIPMGNRFQLIAIAALQSNKSVFVSRDGRWMGGYVPSALRMYPFQLVKPQDREETVLCFDMDSGLLGDAGQGDAFFDASGAPSPALKSVLDFLVEREKGMRLAQEAVDTLQAASLIQPWKLRIKNAEGNEVDVEGIYRIDEHAFNALPENEFIALRKKAGVLPIMYAQLFSMNQLGVLATLNAIQQQANIKPSVQGQSAYTLLNDDILKFS